MGLAASAGVFVAASVLLLLCTRVAIPKLAEWTGIETVFWWFVVGGLGVFLPLIVTAAWILRREGELFAPGWWTKRMRFKRMNAGDWAWSLAAIVAIGALSAGIMKVVEVVAGTVERSPPFMTFDPVTPGRYWLLAVWLPYWLLNIMGEEILWRGVMLPRQETAFGRRAWLVHAAGWAVFHVAFGWQLVLVLMPILLIEPYVVERRGNSWVGVVIHAAVNGPAFLAVALGLL
jgi:membrane protease YdiL (CAAX protease family)